MARPQSTPLGDNSSAGHMTLTNASMKAASSGPSEWYVSAAGFAAAAALAAAAATVAAAAECSAGASDATPASPACNKKFRRPDCFLPSTMQRLPDTASIQLSVGIVAAAGAGRFVFHHVLQATQCLIPL